jgi:Polyketide cyclase / dehydrase and lipid transport
VVRASAADVFAFLTDLSRVPEWDARVAKVTQMTRGALRPGVIVRSELIVDGVAYHLDDEITDFAPPTRLGLRSVLGATNAINYALSEDENGETHLDVVLDYELPDPPPGAPVDPSGLRASIANALTQSLRRLKEIVERETT